MTHLETYLDCLKLLPNELQREFVLMQELDRKAATIQLRLDALENHVLEAATKGITALEGNSKAKQHNNNSNQPVADPSEQQLYEIRTLQADLVDLHNEKLALARQSRDMVQGYAARLDYDIQVFAAELAPEVRAAGENPFEEAGPIKKKHTSKHVSERSSAKEQRSSKSGGRNKRHVHNDSSSDEDDDEDDSDADGGGGGEDEDEQDDEEQDEEEEEDEYAPTAAAARKKSAGGGGMSHAASAAHAAGAASPTGADDGSDDKQLYCICQQPSYGDMVGCDNESCPYEWFHFSCVGLKKHPKGDWVCDECKSKMEA